MVLTKNNVRLAHLLKCDNSDFGPARFIVLTPPGTNNVGESTAKLLRDGHGSQMGVTRVFHVQGSKIIANLFILAGATMNFFLSSWLSAKNADSPSPVQVENTAKPVQRKRCVLRCRGDDVRDHTLLICIIF